jgi:hypothetical protein
MRGCVEGLHGCAEGLHGCAESLYGYAESLHGYAESLRGYAKNVRGKVEHAFRSRLASRCFLDWRCDDLAQLRDVGRAGCADLMDDYGRRSTGEFQGLGQGGSGGKGCG